MKIILLVSKLSGGGAERVASELSLYLPDEVGRTLVLLEEKIDYPYKGDLKVLKTKKVGQYNIFGRIFNILSRYWQFRKIVKEEKPDWVIAFSPALCLMSTLVFRNTVARANNYHSRDSRSWLQRGKVKLAYQRAKIVTAISHGVAEDLRENFGISQDIKVLHNPVDLDSIDLDMIESVNDPEFEYWTQENPTLFFTIGRMIDQKGQWHLLRAFAKVSQEEWPCRLVILGQGPLEQKLKDLARELGVEKSVYFAGFRNNPFTYLARGQERGVFVLPSLYEGFGKVIVEAMACGLPVISTDCRSGPREILAPDTDFRGEAKAIKKERCGILTPVPDGQWREAKEALTFEEEQLASAMYQLISKPDLRDNYIQQSLKRAKDFNVKGWIDRWIQVLTK